MTSGTVSLLFLLLSTRALAQAPTANANFNQVLNLNGDVSIVALVDLHLAHRLLDGPKLVYVPGQVED